MRSFLVAMVLVIAGAVALAQSQPAQATPAAQTPTPTPQTTSATQATPAVFESKEFGISFSIPQGWTVGDDAAKRAYAAAAKFRPEQHLLVLLTRKTGDLPTERITLVAEQFPKGIYVSSNVPEQFLERWAHDHTTLERITDRKQKWYPAFPEAIAYFKSKTLPDRWIELVATTHRETFFRVTGEFNSEEALRDGEKDVQGFKLAPDWQNPNEKLSEVSPGKTLMVRISQGVSQGLLIHKEQLHYPEEARRARVQGSVVMQAWINTHGKIVELRLISGHPLLIDESLRAVSQWRYKPYMLNGEPVNVETQITVNYTLSGG